MNVGKGVFERSMEFYQQVLKNINTSILWCKDAPTLESIPRYYEFSIGIYSCKIQG